MSSDSEWNEESGDASPDETRRGVHNELSSGVAPLERARVRRRPARRRGKEKAHSDSDWSEDSGTDDSAQSKQWW